MLKIRLRRMGARHSPFYRVVVSDSRNVPTASAVEELGYYDPKTQPAKVELNTDRVNHWIACGAQMSPTVKKLVEQARTAPAGAAKAKASRGKAAASAPAPAAAAEGHA